MAIDIRLVNADDDTEKYELSLDGSNVVIVHTAGKKRDEKKLSCASRQEASLAMRREAVRIENEGFEQVDLEDDEDEDAAPDEKAAPSKAGKPAATPKWLAKLPAPLDKQLKKLAKNGEDAGLAHRWDEIAAFAKPGIDLALKKARPADVTRVVSRLGGEPDAPKGFVWPKTRGGPLTFVAQVVLDEVKEHDLEGLLPKSGVLSFFAQLDPDRPKYGEECVVLHFPRAADLARVAPPAEASSTVKKLGVFTPKPRLTVPPDESPVISKLKLTTDEREGYADSVFSGPIPEGRHHLLLGWPTAETHHGLKNKRFLAQFDSDHHVGFEMGDYDTLRFYLEGDAIDATTLKSAVCTLSQA